MPAVLVIPGFWGYDGHGGNLKYGMPESNWWGINMPWHMARQTGRQARKWRTSLTISKWPSEASSIITTNSNKKASLPTTPTPCASYPAHASFTCSECLVPCWSGPTLQTHLFRYLNITTINNNRRHLLRQLLDLKHASFPEPRSSMSPRVYAHTWHVKIHNTTTAVVKALHFGLTNPSYSLQFRSRESVPVWMHGLKTGLTTLWQTVYHVVWWASFMYR